MTLNISFNDVIGVLFPLAVLFALMMIGAYRIRLGIGRKWISILSCGVALVLFVTLGIAFGFISYQSATFADTLRNPKQIPKLASDWGKDLTSENRTKFSKMLAEASYVRRGEITQYFDQGGKSIEFVPTAEDRQQRDGYLQMLQTNESQVWPFAIGAVLMFVLPVLAALVARTGFASWLYGLEGRLEAWRKKA